MLMDKFVVAVDFDGVLADYSAGWQGWDVFGPPIDGAAEASRELTGMGCYLMIWTTRQDTPALRQWLCDAGIVWDGINSTSHNPPHTSAKPIFDVMLDDRAWPRGGLQYDAETWRSAVDSIAAMKKGKENTNGKENG